MELPCCDSDSLDICTQNILSIFTRNIFPIYQRADVKAMGGAWMCLNEHKLIPQPVIVSELAVVNAMMKYMSMMLYLL